MGAVVGHPESQIEKSVTLQAHNLKVGLCE